MPYAWYLTPYKTKTVFGQPRRYCAMDDFTSTIFADGGNWSEIEILGNMAVVKVMVNTSTLLTTIDAATGFTRLPVDHFNDPVDSLPAAKKAAILNKLQSLGYSSNEVTAALGDLTGKTLADVLRFAATRKILPKFDAQKNIVFTGATVSCDSVDALDSRVV